MLTRVLNLLRAVDVGQNAKTEALAVRRVAVAIDEQRRLGCFEDLAHSLSQLVVGDAAPVLGLLINDRLHLCS